MLFSCLVTIKLVPNFDSLSKLRSQFHMSEAGSAGGHEKSAQATAPDPKSAWPARSPGHDSELVSHLARTKQQFGKSTHLDVGFYYSLPPKA